MAAPEGFDAAPNPVNPEPALEAIAPVKVLGELAVGGAESAPEHHTKVHDPHQMTRFRARARGR